MDSEMDGVMNSVKKKKKAVIFIPCGIVVLLLLAVMGFYMPHKHGEGLWVHRSLTAMKTDAIYDGVVFADNNEIHIMTNHTLRDLDMAQSVDEVEKILGKPNGSMGSGVVHIFWRVGEDKYLVLMPGGRYPIYELYVNGERR